MDHVEEEEQYTLSMMQASLFATVLEDAATQLRILALGNTGLRILKTVADLDMLRGKKYGVEQPAVTDELQGIDKRNLNSNKNKLDKLANDRKFCSDSIVTAYLDLALNRGYETIAYINRTRRDRDIYYNALIEDEARNKVLRREVSKQLRQQRNHHKSSMYETDVIIENLKTELDDVSLVLIIRERYMDNWQGARTEQNQQSISDKEAGPSQKIVEYRKKLDHESRVHAEVELVTNIHITETLRKVEDIMDKYDADIEKMDLKIQMKKTDYKIQQEKNTEMEKTFSDHEILMNNWLQFKKEREELQAYRAKMTKAATVVQAWWRGLLVRMCLGPYKPKKKPPGPKKK